MPANLLAVGSINTGGKLTCTPVTPSPGVQFNCTPLAGQFGANAAGVLPVGASGSLSFQVRVPAGVAAGTLGSNTANITSTGPNATPDPNPTNNSQSTNTQVTTGGSRCQETAQRDNGQRGWRSRFQYLLSQ
ncbi:MAG: hypothetical protein IPG76_08915 [Acidobacteria bacterium]|nr:hypothetical protein [Acidobacteriota bacterium]